ncbi:MAG: hypothetical protein ACPH5P_00335 [Akkermansiaceae bacterium]
MSNASPEDFTPGRDHVDTNYHGASFFPSYPNFGGPPATDATYTAPMTGMQDPIVQIRQQVVGGGAAGPCYWKLSVFQDTDLFGTWKYKVSFGLLDGLASEAFDDNNEFISNLSGTDVQVGIRVNLDVDTNSAGYVMPTTVKESVVDGAAGITIIDEAYDEFKFANHTLPHRDISTGVGVIPLGRCVKGEAGPGVWSVKYSLFCDHLNAVYTPWLGMVVYTS